MGKMNFKWKEYFPVSATLVLNRAASKSGLLLCVWVLIFWGGEGGGGEEGVTVIKARANLTCACNGNITI